LKYLSCAPDKIKVVHCCVSPSFKPSSRKFNEIKPVILQVGTGANKNILRVAEALKGIKCHLQILGKLSNHQLKVLEKNGIEYSSIENISDSEVVNLYKKCDLVAFVSTYEGFGLPIIEANATGRAVVTSDIMSMPEVAGEAACLVDPYDINSIRAGVLRIINDTDYRELLITQGYKNIERFRSQKITEKYMKLYDYLLSN
jgi:glycosyltransferase involved in cell wall biosynthesis